MKTQTMRLCAGVATALGLLALGTAASAQQKDEIAITRQPGILYLPTHVTEKRHLIEKQAARLGLSYLKTKWITCSGGAQTDALQSGSVDLVNTGTGNLLLLWDRTKSGVTGIVATSAQPLALVTRDPEIKSPKHYGTGDRMAVPTVKISTQAIRLQMGHPDAASPSRSRPSAISAPARTRSAIKDSDVTEPGAERVENLIVRTIERRPIRKFGLQSGSPVSTFAPRSTLQG